MSLFNHIYSTRREVFPLFEEIRRFEAINLSIKEDNTAIGFRFFSRMGLSWIAIRFMEKIRDMGVNACIECKITESLITEGPKLFRPSADNLEALENMKMTIPFSEYVQPFPTIVIEFPDQYQKKLLAPNPIPNYDLGLGIGPEHQVGFVALSLYKEKEVLLCGTYFTSGQVFSTQMWSEYPSETIEDMIEYINKLETHEKSLPIDKLELEISWRAIRAAMNAVLVMDEVGIKKCGYDNPSHVARLERSIKKGKYAEQSKRELKLTPVVYSFDQNVKFYSKASPHSEGHTGITLRPHWRTGFWKMQPHGPENSLRKRIRINAVLVNAHFFGGKAADTIYVKEL